MDAKHDINILSIIKFPFIFIVYLLYIVLSIFIPSNYVKKIIKIDTIEENINIYFNNPFYLKIIALLITIIIYIFIY